MADAAEARSARILIADDNRDAAHSLALLLERDGHEVRTAHDGEETLIVAAAFEPDVVLLDIGMPKMSGYEAARRLRTMPFGPAALIAAITGWGTSWTAAIISVHTANTSRSSSRVRPTISCRS